MAWLRRLRDRLGKWLIARGITPNMITSVRLILAPIALLLQQLGGQWLFLCLIALALAEISDALDGWLARYADQISEFGKLYDPMADTGFHITIFCGFVASGWMPWWFLPIFYWRDLISSVLRTYIAAEFREAMPARTSGKYKTGSQGTVQITTVLLYLLVSSGLNLPAYWIAIGLMVGSLAITVFSGADYCHQGYLLRFKKSKSAVDESDILLA